MALRDYYRCKQCDAKIAYGPDRPDEDWEPFLLCRDCLATLRSENAAWEQAIMDWAKEVGTSSQHHGIDRTPQECLEGIKRLRTQATQKGSE